MPRERVDTPPDTPHAFERSRMSLALSAILEAVIEKLAVHPEDARAIELAVEGRALLDSLAVATPDQKAECWIKVTDWQRPALEKVSSLNARPR